MKPYERIRYLRKEVLGLTQEEFGPKIGLSRSNAANIETGRVELTDRNISSICSAFRISEAWLRTGEGEIYDSETPSVMDVVAEHYDLSSLERRIVEKFLSLSPESRATVAEYMASIGSDETDEAQVDSIEAQAARADEVLKRYGID